MRKGGFEYVLKVLIYYLIYPTGKRSTKDRLRSHRRGDQELRSRATNHSPRSRADAEQQLMTLTGSIQHMQSWAVTVRGTDHDSREMLHCIRQAYGSAQHSCWIPISQERNAQNKHHLAALILRGTYHLQPHILPCYLPTFETQGRKEKFNQIPLAPVFKSCLLERQLCLGECTAACT